MRSPGLHPPHGVKGFIEGGDGRGGPCREAKLVTLQDSLTPIEYGDKELRAGLSEVRELMDGFSQRARAFVSVFGR